MRLFVFAAFAALSLRVAHAEEYRFRTFDGDDGLNTSVIRHIFAGPHGRIWVTSPHATFRFDGKQFEPVPGAGDLTTLDNVRWITFCEDSVYFRSHDSVFLSTSPGPLRRIRRVAGGLPATKYNEGPYQVMASGPGGRLWFLDATRLLRLTEAGGVELLHDFQMPVHSLLVRPEGEVWAGCGDGLCSWSAGGPHRYWGPRDGVPRERYLALIAHPQSGRLIARGTDRLIEQAVNGFTESTGPLRPLLPDQPEPTLAFDHQRQLLTNSEQGLARREPDGWRFINEANGLVSDVIRAVSVDVDGGIWIGTLSGGILRWLGDGDWRIYGTADGLPRRGSESVVRDGEGNLWVGTLGFGVYRGTQRRGQWRFAREPALGDGGVLAYHEGWIWAATSHGVRRYHPRLRRAEQISHQLSRQHAIRQFQVDDAGRLWAAGNAGLFAVSASGVRRVDQAESAGAIHGLAPNGQGGLWLGTAQGLFRFAALEGIQPVGPRHLVRALARDARGRLWVGFKSQELGLYEWRDGQLHLLHTEKELGPVDPFWILASGEDLWVGTNLGVALRGRPGWYRYGVREGLPGVECRSSAMMPDATMYFASDRGLVQYRPPLTTYRTTPPMVQFEARHLEGRRPQSDELLQIPPTHGNLVVTFAIPSTVAGMQARARYRLLPNTDWTITREQRLDIMGLGPGSYTLEVAAHGVSGAWGRAARLPIVVMPFWYQTKPARAGFLAAGAALAFLGAYLYRRRHWLGTWRLLQDVLQRFPSPVYVCGAGGKVLFANRQAHALPPDEQNHLLGAPAGFDLVAATREEFRSEKQLPDGRRFDVSLFPLFHESGELAFIIGVAVDVSLHRQHEEDLSELSARQTSTLEEERRRISRDIHDDLGQQLVGLKMSAAILARQLTEPELRRRAHALAALAGTTSESVRKIASGLRPDLLDHLGLVAAMQSELKEFSVRTGIETAHAGPDEVPWIDPAAALASFRILQESLSNAARHSGATLVTVTSSVRPGELVLAIADNGRGLLEHGSVRRRPSLGILGMRERARSVGGSLELLNEGGAVVRLTIPLRAGPAPRSYVVSGKS